MHDEAMGASRNGQETSEERLLSTFHALRDELIGTLFYVLGNREDACDAAQDAFIKCWAARDRLGEVADLRAWIFRVSFNAAKDLQRSAWRRKARPLLEEQLVMLAKDAYPGETLERAESLERLRRAIVCLREEEKEVFLLRQNGELTFDQIAELRGCPVSTVKSHMRSALDKLRKALNPLAVQA